MKATMILGLLAETRQSKWLQDRECSVRREGSGSSTPFLVGFQNR